MKKCSTDNFLRLFACALLFFTGCNTAPVPIVFGSDACEFCKMTIVDNKYGAELITVKGKVIKFDSGECMIRYSKTKGIDLDKIQSVLIIDHVDAGKLVNAKSAHFLHSENLSSPMGGGLSAFEKREDLDLFKNTYSGEYWNWQDCLKNINP
jgi:copper chaperone NosL